jgi:hypothetical protein
MKRIQRRPQKFGVLDLFDQIGREIGLSLQAPESEGAFLRVVRDSLKKSREDAALIHGRRVESLFQWVAASLGECIAIKQEDAGDLVVADSNIKIPDYRVILRDSAEYFIEVKNCHSANLARGFPLKSNILAGLGKYGQLFGRKVYIAIYWSRLNLWTLLPLSALQGRASIGLGEAMELNEMVLLGDVMLAANPPLKLRILTDPQRPRMVQKSGMANFTIGDFELYCQDRLIKDEFERSLAFFLMYYGRWPAAEPVAMIEDGQLISIDFVVAPPEVPGRGQGVDIIGHLSSLVTERYNEASVSEQGVERVSLAAEPGSFKVTIPRAYVGKDLPLTQFRILPRKNAEHLEKALGVPRRHAVEDTAAPTGQLKE